LTPKDLHQIKDALKGNSPLVVLDGNTAGRAPLEPIRFYRRNKNAERPDRPTRNSYISALGSSGSRKNSVASIVSAVGKSSVGAVSRDQPQSSARDRKSSIGKVTFLESRSGDDDGDEGKAVRNLSVRSSLSQSHLQAQTRTPRDGGGPARPLTTESIFLKESDSSIPESRDLTPAPAPAPPVIIAIDPKDPTSYLTASNWNPLGFVKMFRKSARRISLEEVLRIERGEPGLGRRSAVGSRAGSVAENSPLFTAWKEKRKSFTSPGEAAAGQSLESSATSPTRGAGGSTTVYGDTANVNYVRGSVSAGSIAMAGGAASIPIGLAARRASLIASKRRQSVEPSMTRIDEGMVQS